MDWNSEQTKIAANQVKCLSTLLGQANFWEESAIQWLTAEHVAQAKVDKAGSRSGNLQRTGNRRIITMPALLAGVACALLQNRSGKPQ